MEDYKVIRRKMMKDFKDSQIQTTNALNTAHLKLENTVRGMDATAKEREHAVDISRGNVN